MKSLIEKIIIHLEKNWKKWIFIFLAIGIAASGFNFTYEKGKFGCSKTAPDLKNIKSEASK